MFMTREKLQARKHGILACLIFIAIISWWGCASYLPADSPAPPEISINTVPWPKADALFHGDQHWLGGDGAYSIDLGGNRVLWLFGDSFIDPGMTRDRMSATVVRNSLAVQRGYDPSTASITFYWREQDHRPSSFFGNGDALWFWPGGGARLRDVLIIFLMKIQPSGNDLGFEAAGFSAVLIDNPDSPPPDWHVRWIPTPENKFGIIVGSASVLALDEYLYAFGADTLVRDVYLARWKITDVEMGNLLNISWWTGKSGRWLQNKELTEKPLPIFSQGQMEFTVHYEPSLECFLQIQTISLADPRLGFRTAPQITGPWSHLEPFFKPGQMGDADLLIYAGKAHHDLSGADMVFTYAVNSTSMDRLVRDAGIYYPVFLKGSISSNR